MLRRLAVAIVLVALSSTVGIAQPVQWSRITIDTLYEHFYYSYPNGFRDDVINLKANPPNFFGQTLSNPHVVIPSDGTNDWLISAYGNRLDGAPDSIFVLRRHYTNGDYVIPTAPALGGGGLSGYSLGAGAAVATGPGPTLVTGYKYFAAVPVAGNGQYWVAWAASTDGTTWKFFGSNQLPVTDPAQSLKVLSAPGNTPSWNHLSMIYMKILNVDYFFLAISNNDVGIRTTWFRLRFDATNSFGLSFDSASNSYIQVLKKVMDPTTRYAFVYQPSGIVDSGAQWQIDAQDPKEAVVGPALAPTDVGDVVALKKADGTSDGVLFLYMPEVQYATQPGRYVYARGSIPTGLHASDSNFQWSQPHKLDTSILWDRVNIPPPTVMHSYSACGSGGMFLSLNQGTGSLSSSLFGFVSTFRDDVTVGNNPCYWNCASASQGLLPVLLKQQSLGLDSISPDSGPTAGGTAVTISGEGFVTGATVNLGGSLASIGSLQPTTISASTPSHGAGAAYLKVTNPNGDLDRIAYAFVYDFTDVPPSHVRHPDVVKLVRNGVTAGCGGNNYCPDSPVTRAEMAVFLLKAKFGFGYSYRVSSGPPYTGGPIPPEPPDDPPNSNLGGFFADVKVGDFASHEIDEIFRMGITGGCVAGAVCPDVPGASAGMYCPTQAIPRNQMAVFLLKTLHSGTFTPPVCANASLPDVPCGAPYADWIYEAVNNGYMKACGTGAAFNTCLSPCVAGQFCPNGNVFRKDMAQHLVSTFGLP